MKTTPSALVKAALGVVDVVARLDAEHSGTGLAVRPGVTPEKSSPR